jgi:hypothetical protein
VRVSHATLDDLVAAVEAAVPLGGIGTSSRESDAFTPTAGAAAVSQNASSGHAFCVCLGSGDSCRDNDGLGNRSLGTTSDGSGKDQISHGCSYFRGEVTEL